MNGNDMVYVFTENGFTVSGDEFQLRELAYLLRDAEGTIGDLRYQIEYEFDIGGVRSSDKV